MGVTRATLRPLFGIVFAALIALSLVATTADALTTPDVKGGRILFDQGFVDRGGGLVKPGPFGRLGVTWE